jgi:hypothetical protein
MNQRSQARKHLLSLRSDLNDEKAKVMVGRYSV